MVARRLSNRGWYVDFVFEHLDGRKERVRKKSPVQTRRGAEEFERHLRVQMINPKTKEKEVPGLSEFSEEFLETYCANNNKPSEIRMKRIHLERHLKPFFKNKRLDHIRVREVESFKVHLRKKGLSEKTVRNVIAVLSKLLRYAAEIELIENSPRIRFPKIPKVDHDFLTFEETDQLLESTRVKYPDWYEMLYFALRTGLRYGELCELRWDDLDLNSGRVVVRRNFVRGDCDNTQEWETSGGSFVSENDSASQGVSASEEARLQSSGWN